MQHRPGNEDAEGAIRLSRLDGIIGRFAGSVDVHVNCHAKVQMNVVLSFNPGFA